MHRRLRILLASVVLVWAAETAGWAEPYHKTSPTVAYKCLFNHELLIVTHKRDVDAQYIQAFIEKLRDTDVDAVMCCPTAWRANLYPSEVDPSWKAYQPTQPLSKYPSYDYIMRYLHAGGDPVRDTLLACRKCGKDFFISYRMNDHHYVTDLTWPTHNRFWREHPEYWLGDTDTSPYTKKDNIRLFNYLLPPVRDYYFAILQELCVNYDVDGVELDFQRFPKFFPQDKLDEGTRTMTAFVRRIREMLDGLGRQRGKSLKLCVRVPETLAKCRAAGLDVPGWDAAQLVDMVNISSFYYQSPELDIEDFRAHTRHAKLFGELNYVTAQKRAAPPVRRYTTLPAYRAAALSLWARGVDGLSLFNYDYVPASLRLPMTAGLRRITDVEYLRTTSQNYVVTSGFGTFPAKNKQTVRLMVPDDVQKAAFQRAMLRIETRSDCTDLRIGAWLNGKPLMPCVQEAAELFAPLVQNAACPPRELLKFYAVPLEAVVAGWNEIKIQALTSQKSCTFVSLEMGLEAKGKRDLEPVR